MKIVELTNPVGLMVRVPDEELETAVKRLVKKSRKQEISPIAIVFDNELEEDLIWTIILWGQR